MQSLFNAINSVPPQVWQLLIAAGVVSVILQSFKHFLSLQNPKVITTLLMALSFAGPALHYIVNYSGHSPYFILAQTFIVSGASTPIYRFLVLPGYQILVDAKTLRANSAAQVTASVPTVTAQPTPTQPTDTGSFNA